MSASPSIDPTSPWRRYLKYRCAPEGLGIELDIGRMDFEGDLFERMAAPIAGAIEAMAALEAGAIANPDEGRMVGHYWLRAPELAPSEVIKKQVIGAVEQVRRFGSDVHAGRIGNERGDRFERILLVGIGGSALGPQFVADALGGAGDEMKVSFLDNTDPDGIDRTLGGIGEGLARTLTIIVSKSGTTPETVNSAKETEAAYRAQGLSMARAAVAVTGETSELAGRARAEGWLAIFPMWDWVGGRTSELSAVGLLPAALQGIDIDELLGGAAAMDRATRAGEPLANPAMLLALMWHWAGGGRGEKAMVILPYKDRLALFARYLQQLVMESLGKERNLEGEVVRQGLTVYGNKGSTDQHAYVQQLREGRDDFFATFIEVRRDREGESIEVGAGATSGDTLAGFAEGTRRALAENGRQSLTIRVDAITPRTIGALIALFERAVGFYASMIGVNAYHQPGVEAGKRAAAEALALQQRALGAIDGEGATAEQIAEALGEPGEAEAIYQILARLAANPGRGVARAPGGSPDEDRFLKA